MATDKQTMGLHTTQRWHKKQVAASTTGAFIWKSLSTPTTGPFRILLRSSAHQDERHDANKSFNSALGEHVHQRAVENNKKRPHSRNISKNHVRYAGMFILEGKERRCLLVSASRLHLIARQPSGAAPPFSSFCSLCRSRPWRFWISI